MLIKTIARVSTLIAMILMCNLQTYAQTQPVVDMTISADAKGAPPTEAFHWASSTGHLQLGIATSPGAFVRRAISADAMVWFAFRNSGTETMNLCYNELEPDVSIFTPSGSPLELQRKYINMYGVVFARPTKLPSLPPNSFTVVRRFPIGLRYAEFTSPGMWTVLATLIISDEGQPKGLARPCQVQPRDITTSLVVPIQ